MCYKMSRILSEYLVVAFIIATLYSIASLGLNESAFYSVDVTQE